MKFQLKLELLELLEVDIIEQVEPLNLTLTEFIQEGISSHNYIEIDIIECCIWLKVEHNHTLEPLNVGIVEIDINWTLGFLNMWIFTENWYWLKFRLIEYVSFY